MGPALPVLLAALFLFASSSALHDFQEQCQLHCPLQNRTQDIHLDVGCGPECKLEQCLRGCRLWSKALQASCQAVCNGTQDLVPPKELYCVMGCNDALNRYLQQLKESLGGVKAPELVADSVTSRSLMLEWEKPGGGGVDAGEALAWALQWRYEAPSTPWAFSPHLVWATNHTVLVHHLTPYTKYRFRVAVVVPGLTEAVVSEASLVMGTLAEGRPSSAPGLLRAAPTDPTRVSVSWAPGPFPNGPILSYVLSIDELPTGYKAHKDIPASENKHFYMFQNLSPSKNYSVSVAMRNGVGLGPAAALTVATPPLSQVKGTEKTVLVLAGQHTVTSQPADMLDDPLVLYKTHHFIRGVGVDVRGGQVFVSDSEGEVVGVASAGGGGAWRRVLPPQEARPHALSVDWLNGLLYLLGRSSGGHWQVSRCNMDGSALTVALAGLPTKPLHMEVDPYNGYLWWVTEGRGLFRLDLADISNGVRHEAVPDLVLPDPDLGAFTVDHTNFRVLVPDHSQNTVLAVSLDGGEVVDVRTKTQRPQFRRVVSLATAGGLFYWTDGARVLTEEYHPGQDSFFHNLAYPAGSDPAAFVAVRALVLSSQPVPLPVNPPTALQAVVGPDLARASWAPPHLLGGQGRGAWQNWTYRVRVESEEGGRRREVTGITGRTWYTVRGLRPGTSYTVRVAAYTSSGAGPWSAPFTARTLSAPGARASILWSAAEGLLVSDTTGDTVHTLIHRDALKDGETQEQVTDMAWFRDQLYLVTNSSSLYWYNMTSRARGRLRDVDTVASIAVDWLGKKLYWSNPKQQLITRGNLNGSQQEPLPILTVARELNIDAVDGYIYWSTGHAVESAHLNGKTRRVYYPAELFSGKQVMGLTLDTRGKSLYWIVRSHEGSSLLRAPLAHHLPPAARVAPLKMSTLQYPDMRGSLCYFDERLLWLRDEENAVIGDMSGRNSALLTGLRLTGLNAIAVLDDSLHFLPEGLSAEEVNVIPEAIPSSSLRVVGNFSVFNITWDPVRTVNYGQVFYELKIRQTERKDIVVETREPWWRYAEETAPYSRLVASVRALTYWGGSSQTTAELRTPPSTPSQPANPRLYLQHSHTPLHQHKSVTGLFRWDAPLSPNGVVVSYSVTCWTDAPGEPSPCPDEASALPGSTHEFVASHLPPNSSVFFQVRGCTEVGCGVGSAVVRGDCRVESPAPRLLAASGGDLVLADLDTGGSTTLARPGRLTALDYSSSEARVFWLDDNSRIVTARLGSLEKNKVVSLNRTGTSLAVDWVGRRVYWGERGAELGGGALVKSLDLGRPDPRPSVQTLVSRPAAAAAVLSLQVDPLHSQLYWVELKQNGFTTIMTSQCDGSDLREYFGHSHRRTRREACSCPESPIVGQLLHLDHRPDGGGGPRLLWLDAASNSLVSSDLEACSCRVLLHGEKHPAVGFPPSSLTAGLEMVYWSNETEGRLYSLRKTGGGGGGGQGEEEEEEESRPRVARVSMPHLRTVSAYGPHLQPFPELSCLLPGALMGEPEVVVRGSEGLVLRLPPLSRPRGCRAAPATPRYTLHYAPVSGEDLASTCAASLHNCSTLESWERLVKVEGLEAARSYVFLVTVVNHYTELAGLLPKASLPVLLQTAPGAPAAPEGLEVAMVSPGAAAVTWRGEAASYQVLWRSGSSQGQNSVTDRTTATLNNLLPNHTYDVWVKAYSSSTESHSESEVVTITTYPEPNNITLLEATPYSLNVSWKNYEIQGLAHEVEVSEASGEWARVPLHAAGLHGEELYLLDRLHPKSVYTFRLRLTYAEGAPTCFWPPDNRFTFRTLGDRPSPPGPPVTQHLRGEVYQVIWEPSRENGAAVEMYWLEGKVIQEVERSKRGANFSSPPTHTTTPGSEWTLYYNGTDNYWIITELNAKDKYRFRARSRNSYGWSEWSEESGSFEVSTTAHLADRQDIALVLWLLTPAALLLTTAVFVCIFYRHEKEKKAVGTVGDVELATLRELPRRGDFVQSSNALYDPPPAAASLSAPRLRRDQITLTRFLGSGAFGEVFEGKARVSGGETRVAVKTLRKGASEQEKAEFLKEAQLMSNFRHPHILQLLGVCLDNDPSFIIMELMEGGDLLTYLRSSRPVMSVETSLGVEDLVRMSVDVARGCCYLEEMHFVHRDLACRNCLVSSADPLTRVVKIGDFGLARDIYKNDYYRKEGEGLLPVRWMAPESLVDGVFTSQSDVWAFGVLVWEIMSLGQQPYPARTNLEVLHYVRNGGRLGQPLNTTLLMYDLMMKCWSFNPEERPTFRYCLDVLQELRADLHDAPLPTSEERRLRREAEAEAEGGSVPKYLELIYDEEGSGYEIPRSLEGEGQAGAPPHCEASSLEKLLPSLQEKTAP